MKATFPIVGADASAGGLEALEQFLRCLPGREGLALVIIQHSDPAHKPCTGQPDRFSLPTTGSPASLP